MDPEEKVAVLTEHLRLAQVARGSLRDAVLDNLASTLKIQFWLAVPPLLAIVAGVAALLSGNLQFLWLAVLAISGSLGVGIALANKLSKITAACDLDIQCHKSEIDSLRRKMGE
jgi:hypothetical protein